MHKAIRSRMMNALEISPPATAESRNKKRSAGEHDIAKFRSYCDSLQTSMKELSSEKSVLMELLRKKDVEIESLMNAVYTHQRLIEDLLEKASNNDNHEHRRMAKLHQYYDQHLKSIHEGLLECTDVVAIVRNNGTRKAKLNRVSGEGTSRPAGGDATNDRGKEPVNLDGEEEPSEESGNNLVDRYFVEHDSDASSTESGSCSKGYDSWLGEC